MKTNNHLTITTHAGIAQLMVRALGHYGVDAGALFADAGLAENAGHQSDRRVAAVKMQMVWRSAVAQTGDEAFGLTFARQMHPAALHGLGFAWAASNTLHDAFLRLVRFYRLITTAGEVVLDEEGELLRLLFRIPAEKGKAAPASLDAALALFLQLCRFTKDESFAPVRAELQRSPPADPQPYQQFFACEVRFDCDENSLYFDRAELDQPLPLANPELARANDQVIIDYLARHDQDDVVSAVRARVIDWLPSGTPSQAEIAEALNMSPRTLQRRLGEKDRTFSALLEEVRHELAEQYLKMPQRSVAEVAYLLGFSEPGNFARSFKRWTGLTPAEYQAAP